jgi:hypothetical protein
VPTMPARRVISVVGQDPPTMKPVEPRANINPSCPGDLAQAFCPSGDRAAEPLCRKRDVTAQSWRPSPRGVLCIPGDSAEQRS